MLKERARAVAIGLRALDLATIAVAFPIAYVGRDALVGERLGGLFPIGRYIPLLAVALATWPAAAFIGEVYGTYRTRSLTVELARLARAVAWVAFGVAAATFLWKWPEISRLLVALHLALAFVLLAGTRVALRLAARSARRRGRNTRAFAVVGTGPLAEAARDALLARPSWGFTFAGYVLAEGEPERTGRGRILGPLADLGTLLERNVVDLVVFAVTRDGLAAVEPALRVCDEQGVPAKIVLDLFPRGNARMAVEELDGIPLLSLQSGPTDVLALVAKRAFDVLVSAVVLALLSPLLLVIAAAIKLESRGPIFFRQRRVGLNGRGFILYKFRSMRADAEALLPGLLGCNEMGGPVFKMRDDPRVTRVGRLLRRASLDELPQFWNVLRGEMSVVGPRPPLPAEVEAYARWQRRRLSVKPGITCTWQVSGRNEIDFERWIELDLHYIDTWSLWSDLLIVLKTIPAVILGRGAR